MSENSLEYNPADRSYYVFYGTGSNMTRSYIRLTEVMLEDAKEKAYKERKYTREDIVNILDRVLNK